MQSVCQLANQVTAAAIFPGGVFSVAPSGDAGLVVAARKGILAERTGLRAALGAREGESLSVDVLFVGGHFRVSGF